MSLRRPNKPPGHGARRVNAIFGAEWPHGTRGHYANHGCRCNHCRRANATYSRHYYQKNHVGPGQGFRSDLA